MGLIEYIPKKLQAVNDIVGGQMDKNSWELPRLQQIPSH